MKLQKLTIHNIASIEDAEIDFTTGPLANDSTFLITGETGTGKTTLLDCLSYVLYGKTPRLNLAANEQYTSEQGYEYTIGNACQLARRGTGSSSISLSFTDREEKPLVIIWEIHHANGHPDGRFQTPSWRLETADGQLLYNKVTDIRSAIPQLIGLTYDQFCKTTMLAQGDFTQFLKANPDEKSDILEKLTGTQIYSQISQKIQQTTADKKRFYDDCLLQLKGITLLSPQQIAEKEAAQRQLEEANAALDKRAAEIQGKAQWLKAESDAQQKTARYTAELEAAKQQQQTKDYRTSSALLKDWNNTVEIRGQLQKKDEAAAALSTLMAKKDDFRHEFGRLCKGNNALQASLDRTRRQLEQQRAQKAQLSQHESTYNSVGTIETIHGQYERNLEAISRCKREESAAQLSISGPHGLDGQIAAEQQHLAGLTARHGENEKLYEQTRQELQATDLEELNQLNSSFSARKASHLNLKQQFKERDKLMEDLKALQRDIAGMNETIAAQRTLIAGLEVNAKKAAFEAADQSYEKAKSSCADTARMLRSELREGDICPVCGQRISQVLSNARFLEALQPVKDHREAAKKAWEAVQQQQLAAEGLIQAQQKLLPQKNKQLSSRQEELHQLLTDMEKTADYARLKDMPVPSMSIDIEISIFDKTLAEVAKGLEAYARQQKAVEGQRTICEQSAKAVTDSKEKIAQYEAARQLKIQAIENLRKAATGYREENERLLEQLRGIISLENWEAEWNSNRKDFIERLQKAAAEYAALSAAIVLAESGLDAQQPQLSAANKAQKAIDALNMDWLRHPEANAQENVRELPSSWTEFTARLTAYNTQCEGYAATIAGAEAQLDGYAREEGHLQESRLAELNRYTSAQLQHVREAVALRDRAVTDAAANLSTAKAQLEQLHTNQPELAETDTEEVLLENARRLEEEKQTNTQTLGGIIQELKADSDHRGQFKAQQEAADAAHAVFEKWSHLNELFGSADGKKFRVIAQSFVLEHLLECANVHLSKLTDRYELTCQPGSLTILIKDMAAGGVLRPTSTLSGGESFMVSLSLALGLSSLSRADVSMDTLFIDEGFGTLDKEYLDTVLNALEKLHQNGGKRVGIISHVETLQERITTQIQVKRKKNSTASEVKVVSLI